VPLSRKNCPVGKALKSDGQAVPNPYSLRTRTRD
jgi:hypothetical protein